MLNRKESKMGDGAHKNGRTVRRETPKPQRQRRRFIISRKAPSHSEPHLAQPRKLAAEPQAAPAAKPQAPETPAPGTAPTGPFDLNEIVKTLLHLAHEHGHLTYDDINDVLPEGLSPELLDQLYRKLRNLDIEIVDHPEVER